MSLTRGRTSSLPVALIAVVASAGCSLDVDVEVQRGEGISVDASFEARLPGSQNGDAEAVDETTPLEPTRPAPPAPPAPPAAAAPQPVTPPTPTEPPIPAEPAPPASPLEPTVVDGAVRDALWRPEMAEPMQLVHRPTYEPIPVPDLREGPTFTPFTDAPELLNRLEVERRIDREYPAGLRERGIGASVRVYLFVDEDGNVLDAELDRGSTFEEFNDAALRVAPTHRFFPALNRGSQVPVWISMRIEFEP